MKVFVATYSDFIKFNKKPNEDFYLVSKKFPLFAIADGVTQACFPTGEYAFPLGARAAAEIFCYTVMRYLEKKLKEKINYKGLIEIAFNLANKRIEELNENEGITERLDYLFYDYFDTVGVVGFIAKNKLYYGYVGDCGLAIFNKNNKIIFKTNDDVAKAVNLAKKIYKKWGSFSLEQKSLILHSQFRNRKDGRGYGSFTGEKVVKRYYRIGRKSLNEGDLILFYSDGFLNYLSFPKFLKLIKKMDRKNFEKFTNRKAKENYEKYGTDRTIVAIEFGS